MINITEVKVFLSTEEKLKAYITLVIDNNFVVRDLKIIEGAVGLFIAMPSKRQKDGSFKDVAHPINLETRQKLERVILDAYILEIQKIKKTNVIAQ
jgi:stage V sporulation protein G